MNAYHTPIPNAVWEHLRHVLAKHQGHAFDVRVQAFPGNDDGQMFAVDVYEDAVTKTPKDRRQNAYVNALQTTYYFDAFGTITGEPSSVTTRYQG